MASANAIVQWKRLQHLKRTIQAEQNEADDEDAPLISSQLLAEFPTRPPALYVIEEKIEMGQMASLFFNRFGRTLLYLCFAVYLYGDLSIYSAAVSKSLTNVACTFRPDNIPCNQTLPDSEVCWEGVRLTRMDAYRIFLTVFVCLLGPFAFFDVQKTKYLQIITSLMRWFAFSFMIVYAARKLVVDGPKGHPSVADISGIPGLFGACVYSFMCHHSLPALVSPIADKSRLSRFLALDYLFIASFYLLLAMTGAFAFEHLHDLYTLDFSPSGSGDCDAKPGLPMKIVEYFLALFPVFTLSTSFPIIAITLRNNLKALFLTEGRIYRWSVRQLFFPLLAVLPPVMIAMVTKNLKILVGVTGSYAGTGIQYLIPAFLVFAARKETRSVIGVGVRNEFASPFAGKGWVAFVIVWAIACIILVSIDIANNLL